MFGIDSVAAHDVDDGKQHVARLQQFFVIGLCLREFVQFLAQFVYRARDIGPFETDPCCTLLQFVRAQQGGKRVCDAVHRAALSRSRPFCSLDILPPAVFHDAAFIAKDMRMARLHFVGDATCDVFEGKISGFLGHARMEHDLEKQITEFAAQIVHVAAFDGVGDLVGFFDRIRCNGGKVLRRVPFTAADGITKAGHDAEQAVGLIGHGCLLTPRLREGKAAWKRPILLVGNDNIYYVK